MSEEEISKAASLLGSRATKVIDEKYGLENHGRMMANARWKKKKRPIEPKKDEA